MLATKEPNAVPIPGYRLLAFLGRGGFGEVWKCEAPGGLVKAIKFVQGTRDALDVPAPATQEYQALQRVKAIRHPYLLSLDRVEVLDGELVIVTELADKSLQDVHAAYRASGSPGVPRQELLGYLREAAEALDLMNLEHGLQHLDIKPGNLFLVSGHVKVGDFGLVSGLQEIQQESGVSSLGGITPRYAAPEIFRGQISPQSDQYSLAIVYQELLTGTVPHAGKNARQLMFQHSCEEPDLHTLPLGDRAAVGRALAKDPGQRFASCMDLVRALAFGPTDGAANTVIRSAFELALPPSALPSVETLPPAAARAKEATVHDPEDSASSGTRCAALPGYQFVDCLGRTPFLEAWKVLAPDGSPRLLKFLLGNPGAGGRDEAQRLAVLRSLYHPGLLQAEFLKTEAGQLVVVSDIPEETLREKAQGCRAQGKPGVPRRELLDTLRGVAATLDALRDRSQVQHLNLSPTSLVLQGGKVLVTDYGLAQYLWLPAGKAFAEFAYRYAAPELLDGQVSPHADQYSLALIYYELLTGAHVYHGLGLRRLQAVRRKEAPDLAGLPTAERRVLAAALNVSPGQRYSSCTQLIDALDDLSPPHERRRDGNQPAELPALIAVPPGAAPVLAQYADAGAAEKVISKLFTTVSRTSVELNLDALLARDGCLKRCGLSALPVPAARQRLEEFRSKWLAQAARGDKGRFVARMYLPTGFLKRCLGQTPGLEIDIRLDVAPGVPSPPTEVTAVVRPLSGDAATGIRLLKDLGADLLGSALSYLEMLPDRRRQERLAFHKALEVIPVTPERALGDALLAQAKDISLGGIGFTLAAEPPTKQVYVRLGDEATAPVAVLTQLVRVRLAGAGQYEYGGTFPIPRP